jgi:hypothetical protein
VVYKEEHEMVEFFELSSLERDDDDLDLRNAGARGILRNCVFDNRDFLDWVRENGLSGLVSGKEICTPRCGGTFRNEEEFDEWVETLDKSDLVGYGEWYAGGCG